MFVTSVTGGTIIIIIGHRHVLSTINLCHRYTCHWYYTQPSACVVDYQHVLSTVDIIDC